MKRSIILLFIWGCFIFLFACERDIDNLLSDEQSPGNETSDTNEDSSPGEIPLVTNSPDVPPDNNNGTDISVTATGEVVISFYYTRQSGPASNQHAVWIEDVDGQLIKTLFASRWTAEGGYATRPDSIALWAKRAGLADMSSTEVDAVSGATPATGLQSYTWDLTDTYGNPVPQGKYILFVEGTLRWKNFVLYRGEITIGNEPVNIQFEPQFHYESSDRYEALTNDSTENNMIGPVTAEFTP